MVLVKINKTVTLDLDELKELVKLVEKQETTDRYENTELCICGYNAVIDVKIDSMGDIELL